VGGLESITVHEGGYMSVYINFLHSHSKQHKVIFSALNCEIKKVYYTAEPVNSTCGSVVQCRNVAAFMNGCSVLCFILLYPGRS
jgi:hypothetical protein